MHESSSEIREYETSERVARPELPAMGVVNQFRALHALRWKLRGVPPRSAFSLWELMAVVAILGVLAALIVPRVVGSHSNAKRAACFVNQGEIEMQAKLWRRNSGSYPAANLADVGSDAAHFPEGLPTCPVDGTSYTIDTTSGLVIGHTH